MSRAGWSLLIARARRPVFGKHGRAVVGLLCGYECIALVTPLPTISELVTRYPRFGVLLLLLLGHHWFVETEVAVVTNGPAVLLAGEGSSSVPAR